MGRHRRRMKRAPLRGRHDGIVADYVVFDEALPTPAAAPILPGLPGGPPHMSRSERKLLDAELRLEATARVAAYRFDGYVRAQDAERYGFPLPLVDVAAERDRLLRARARAGGLEVPEPEERPGEERTAGGLILPAKRKRPRQRPRLFIPGKDR